MLPLQFLVKTARDDGLKPSWWQSVQNIN